MKTYAFEDSWHLWEYFHNQSARFNLNSISSFHSSQVPNQNADQDHHCQFLSFDGDEKEGRSKSVLGFIRSPQLVLCGSYDGITTRSDHGGPVRVTHQLKRFRRPDQFFYLPQGGKRLKIMLRNNFESGHPPTQ